MENQNDKMETKINQKMIKGKNKSGYAGPGSLLNEKFLKIPPKMPSS